MSYSTATQLVLVFFSFFSFFVMPVLQCGSHEIVVHSRCDLGTCSQESGMAFQPYGPGGLSVGHLLPWHAQQSLKDMRTSIGVMLALCAAIVSMCGGCREGSHRDAHSTAALLDSLHGVLNLEQAPLRAPCSHIRVVLQAQAVLEPLLGGAARVCSAPAAVKRLPGCGTWLLRPLSGVITRKLIY